MRETDPTRDRRVVLVGKRARFAVAEPFFESGPQLPLRRGSARVRPGRLALADVDRDGARLVQELGSPQTTRDVLDALLLDRGVRAEFPDELRAAARSAADEVRVAGSEGRADLSQLPTFTVDPASARDFDDAVSAEPNGDGWRLWIHIADVSAHVRPGTGLEAEAYERGTSVYVPGAVAPMLPAVLSEEACSLAPGAPRPAVSAELEVTAAGEVVSERYRRSWIRSDARLDYDELDEVFAGRRRPPDAVAEPVALARASAAALRDRRPVGSIGLSTTEPEFVFEDGDVVAAHRVAQTEAHGLIEQLMVTCNERVASLLERRRIPTLYRVHERPDPARVSFLLDQLRALDLPTPVAPDRMTGSEAAEIAGEASSLVARDAARRGHGADAYGGLVLRALQQARYSDQNLGHAGLGSAAYAHFTSPIRRYPDLVAHRSLLSAVGEAEDPPDSGVLASAAAHSSERERAAAAVQRDADDVCAAFLLERELFEAGWEREFEGEVSGVIPAAAFVAFGGSLGDTYEGFLPARHLRGDRFDLDETETALVGRRSGSRLRLGDPVSVRVERIEAARGRVDLLPVEEP